MPAQFFADDAAVLSAVSAAEFAAVRTAIATTHLSADSPANQSAFWAALVIA
jgi:hypothetical protein